MNNKEILLKKDWDYQPHIGDEQGHHIIRKREQKLLLDFLARRKEGALLMSGRRGVGKSSVIFSTINKINKENLAGSLRLIPVLVNAPSFDIAGADEKIPPEKYASFKKIVLQSLIRRLYKACQSTATGGAKKKIEGLYKRAVAKEVRQEIQKESSEKQASSFAIESIFKFEVKNIFIFITSIIGALGFASIPFGQFGGLWQYAISFLIAIVPSISLAVSSQKKKTSVTGIESQDKASDYYLYDYDLGNLQSELEDTLSDLTSKDHKIIFVIDELDKMNDKIVIHAIKSLKTLINQGNSIFVFITGPELLDFLRKQGRESKEFTLFSQTIFLQRPLFDEMEEFIDSIIENKRVNLTELKQDRDYKNFRNYACYVSQTDFFDLYNVIRDHISNHDKKGIPIINIELTANQKLQANLQKAMGQIYLRKFYGKPSDWRKNDLLLRRLYSILSDLETRNPQVPFTVSEGFPLVIQFPNEDSIKILDEIESGAVRDLIDYLTRLKFLTSPAPNQFQVTGTISQVPSNPSGSLTQEERTFINECEKLGNSMISFLNLYNSKVKKSSEKLFEEEHFKKNRGLLFNSFKNLEIDLDGFKPILEHYDLLTQDLPHRYTREEIIQFTNQIIPAKNQVEQGYHSLLGDVVTSHLNESVEIESFPNLTNANSTLGLSIPDALIKTSVPNSVLHQTLEEEKEDKENYLLIIQNTSQELINEISKPRANKNFSVIYLVQEELSKELKFSNNYLCYPNEFSDFGRKFRRPDTDVKDNFFPPSLPITMPLSPEKIDQLLNQLPTKLQILQKSRRSYDYSK